MRWAAVCLVGASVPGSGGCFNYHASHVSSYVGLATAAIGVGVVVDGASDETPNDPPGTFRIDMSQTKLLAGGMLVVLGTLIFGASRVAMSSYADEERESTAMPARSEQAARVARELREARVERNLRA